LYIAVLLNPSTRDAYTPRRRRSYPELSVLSSLGASRREINVDEGRSTGELGFETKVGDGGDESDSCEYDREIVVGINGRWGVSMFGRAPDDDAERGLPRNTLPVAIKELIDPKESLLRPSTGGKGVGDKRSGGVPTSALDVDALIIDPAMLAGLCGESRMSEGGLGISSSYSELSLNEAKSSMDCGFGLVANSLGSECGRPKASDTSRIVGGLTMVSVEALRPEPPKS